MRIPKVISGGQTGVDQGALDAALEWGLPCGGWCPLNRKSEQGRIPERYPLRETHSSSYALRTRWNIRDADGTLIFSPVPPSGGTALTWALARRMPRPVLIQRPDSVSDRQILHLVNWLRHNHIWVLNVAGPRESHVPGIQEQTRQFLLQLFTCLKSQHGDEQQSSF